MWWRPLAIVAMWLRAAQIWLYCGRPMHANLLGDKYYSHATVTHEKRPTAEIQSTRFTVVVGGGHTHIIPVGPLQGVFQPLTAAFVSEYKVKWLSRIAVA
eukprot:22084-Eustigmatos_ZCMA.PRE.1